MWAANLDLQVKVREFEADINVVDAQVEKRVQNAHALFPPRILDGDETASVQEREDRGSAENLVDLEELLVNQLGRNGLLLFLTARRATANDEGVVYIVLSIYARHLAVVMVLGLTGKVWGLAGLFKNLEHWLHETHLSLFCDVHAMQFKRYNLR